MAIDNYADAQGLRDIIQEVLLPTDVVVETKNGKRKEKEVLRFPNYLFLKLVYGNNDKLDKELWYKIRNTNGVTGFVAPDPNKPSPMSEDDLIKMGLVVPTTVEVDYEVGDLIIITDGYASVPEIQPLCKAKLLWIIDNEASFQGNGKALRKTGRVCLMQA
jgi:transcriptional antiterminator NusG